MAETVLDAANVRLSLTDDQVVAGQTVKLALERGVTVAVTAVKE